ncbi:hypothetical protein ACWKSP_37800 [Micromonosporaceae bacterium Da 78-11]
MNLTDLHDVLDERSATDHTEARSHLTLTGVHRRLAIRRRRRITATAAAFVAVLAVGAGTLAVHRSTGRTPEPTSSPSPTVPTVGGFPEYAEGARVIAASTPLEAGAKSVRLEFTPRTTALVIFARCDDSALPYDIALNGSRPIMSGEGCGTALTPDPTDKSTGVEPGRPSVLTATFPKGVVAGFVMAVGEKIPVDQYVFPPRPATLAPVEDTGDMRVTDDQGADYGTTKVVRSDPADPNRPVEVAFTWGVGVHLRLRAQTPGAIRVSINGVQVVQGQWWDYGQTLIDGGDDSDWPKGGLLARGASATITVTPERMTGEWAVVLQQAR